MTLPKRAAQVSSTAYEIIVHKPKERSEVPGDESTASARLVGGCPVSLAPETVYTAGAFEGRDVAWHCWLGAIGTSGKLLLSLTPTQQAAR